jgi:hypothetical protein
LRNNKLLRALVFLLGCVRGVTLTTTSALEVDTLQHQRQLRGVDLHVRRARGHDGAQLEGSSLETLVTHDEMQALRLQRHVLCA